MAAAFRPMSPAEPQLTAAQEARGWAVLDALDAAKASGDECRILQASLDLLDWQLAVGLLTVADIRRWLLVREPMGYSRLTQIAIRLQELDPVAAEGAKAFAVDRMFDPDPESAGWGALVVEAFETAKDECGAGLLLRLDNDQIECIRPLLKSWGYFLPPRKGGDHD